MTDRQAEIATSPRPGSTGPGVGDGILLADGAPGPSRRHAVRMTSVAVVLLLAGVGLYLLAQDRDQAVVDAGVFPVILATALFGIAELELFDVRVGRRRIASTLWAIPMAIALVFLDPAIAIAARIAGAGAVVAVVRHDKPLELFVRLSLAVFEMAMAAAVFRALVDLSSGSETAIIVAATLSLLMVRPLGPIVILSASRRPGGGATRRSRDDVVVSWWLCVVDAVLGVLTVAAMLVEPVLGLIAMFPVACLWFGLRSFGRVSAALRDLDLVHGFGKRIGESLDIDEIASVAAREMAAAFRGRGAAVVRFAAEPCAAPGCDDRWVRTEHVQGTLGVAVPRSPDDPAWQALTDDGAQVLTASQARQLGIEVDRDVRSMLVGPIGGTGASALAIVSRDSAAGEEFAADDVDRLRTMSQLLAASLRRGTLHARLEYEARHDALTDLPARTMFERSVEDVISERSGDEHWSVLMIDLDQFKEVNDTLGHHAGDALLVEFSRRISSVLAPGDQLARLAGDEFAILAHLDAEGADQLAREVVRVAGAPVSLDGYEIVVTASVGVAEIHDDDERAVAPIRRADIAMYNAKWQRTSVERYRDEIDRRTPARLSMLGDLRTAIKDEAIEVVYQPKLELASDSIVGAEALVRWTHSTRGTVAPADFVRVAEDAGLIKDLTDFVLSQSIAALRRFRDAGLGIGLAVNLSTHDLFDTRLPERIRSNLEANRVEPHWVTLELTESSLLVDAPRSRATIDDLHRVGLRLSVDDFGTGYSSLNYLRRLPVQELKIDQSFVTGLGREPQDEVIVRSTIDLGHNLGLSVVAEGVESCDVLDRLRAIGCDVAQGFMISPPLSAESLIDWVAAGSPVNGHSTASGAVG